MSNEAEPAYKAGESWLEFLDRRGIPRDKAKPIHEIQWLRCERIRWMAEAERHRMTEEERRTLEECADPLAVAKTIRSFLARTASPAES